MSWEQIIMLGFISGLVLLGLGLVVWCCLIRGGKCDGD